MMLHQQMAAAQPQRCRNQQCKEGACQDPQIKWTASGCCPQQMQKIHSPVTLTCKYFPVVHLKMVHITSFLQLSLGLAVSVIFYMINAVIALFYFYHLMSSGFPQDTLRAIVIRRCSREKKSSKLT